jgi:hypothetical protein
VAEGYLSPKPIKAMLAAHLADTRDHGSRLWLLANLEAWYRIHIEGQDRNTFQRELERNPAYRAGRAAALRRQAG